MNLFFFVTVLLRYSLATTVNFTQVYQWNELEYESPSEANGTHALKYGTFEPEKIEPIFMAVFGTRIFLSLHKDESIPATLVSLPTTSASSSSPKLTPFPSWNMNEYGNCDKIEEARGLHVDAIGRLWVLDSGSDKCEAKLWTIDLIKNDHTELIHRFLLHYSMHTLVLDETKNETLAYITRAIGQYIVVFSLERNQSWIVNTTGIKVLSIALSPNNEKEPRQLYLGKYDSNELYSISAAALRNGTRTSNPKLIGHWTSTNSYRMQMDNHGTMYAAFWWKNYIASYNTSSLSFNQQHFYEVGDLNNILPFTFALDSSGTFWMAELNKTATKPILRLLKTAVNPKQKISNSSTTTDVSTLSSITIKPDCECREGGPYFKKEGKTGKSLNSAIIGSLAFFLVLSCFISLWLTLRMRKLRNSNEQRDAGAVEMELPTVPNSVSPEMVDEEIENDLYGVVITPRTRL